MTTPALDARGREIPNLPAGYYRHYKGETYQVLGIAHDSNAEHSERLVVVYAAPPGKPGPALAVRNLFFDEDHGDGTGFFDWVMPETGALTDGDPGYWPLPFTAAHEQALASGEGMEGPTHRPTAVRRFTYLGPVRP